jgi:excinuclease ABC subunit B
MKGDQPEDRVRTVDELEKEIKSLEKEMRSLAKSLEFEKAAAVRDRIRQLRTSEFGLR